MSDVLSVQFFPFALHPGRCFLSCVMWFGVLHTIVFHLAYPLLSSKPFVERHPFETTGGITVVFSIPLVLSTRDTSEVAAAVVCWVAVDVVDDVAIAFFTAHNQAVKLAIAMSPVDAYQPVVEDVTGPLATPQQTSVAFVC